MRVVRPASRGNRSTARLFARFPSIPERKNADRAPIGAVAVSTMSLSSSRTAVISLGMSCQTSRQIKVHHRLLRSALRDEDLHPVSSFFNNLISPITATTSLFAADLEPPSSAAEIVRWSRPFWERHGMFFWHDAFEPDTLCRKYQHLSGKLRALRDKQRLIFVNRIHRPTCQKWPVQSNKRNLILPSRPSALRGLCVKS